MPSYSSIKSGASFQGRDADLAEMVEEIKEVKVGDRSVAVASYWYNRKWLVQKFFPDECDGLTPQEMEKLADDKGLPSRCPASLWALGQVEKERQDIFVHAGLSFTKKMVRTVIDLATLDADGQPGAYKVPYLNGPTGSGKTMVVRSYAAAVGKAYYPVLCTGDNDEMLTKKLVGHVSLRVGVRTEEMKKRAQYGVFDTDGALLSFLRALKKHGGGDTLESHAAAFQNIQPEDWDGIAADNGLPSDQSFAGTFVLGEAALGARIPGGVLVNFDEIGLVSETVQAAVRDGFSDRSEVHRYGVNHMFATTDNPPGAGYSNRTPLSRDTAARLQSMHIGLPGPDEMVPDVCMSLGHAIDAEESLRRMSNDPKCSTTPGLGETRSPILEDREGMDADLLPPAEVIRRTANTDAEKDPSKFFSDLLGATGGEKYAPNLKKDKAGFTSTLLSREQAVNLSMRIVSLFCRVYQQLTEPTGALNPRMYNHESANSPEISRRTFRSICAGIEDQMRGALERSRGGEQVNIPEALSLSVMRSLDMYIFKQVDFRAAPTGTTLEGDSNRKAARESRPVISQLIRESGLGWGDLMELFAPAQVGWIEDEVAKMTKGSQADMSKVAAAAAEITREMKPQDSIVKIAVNNESIFVPVEVSPGDELSRIDGTLLYRTLDPHNDGITKEQLQERLDQYTQSGGGEPLFDFILGAAAAEGVGGNAQPLCGRLKKSDAEIDCKWGGDISKTNSGCGIYLIPLGGERALALDYGINPSRKKSEISWTLLEGKSRISEFICATVLDRDSPGFSVPGQDRVRKHTTITLVKPTGGVLRVSSASGNLEVGGTLPPIEDSPDHETKKTLAASRSERAEQTAPLPKAQPASSKTRKKQVYTRK